MCRIEAVIEIFVSLSQTFWLQWTKATNRCQVCPAHGESRAGQWGLCAFPGASRCVRVYCFPLIFIWPLGSWLFFTIFLLICFEEKNYEAIAGNFKFRWQDNAVGFDGIRQLYWQCVCVCYDKVCSNVFNKKNDKLGLTLI